jgi:hypothetical protein
MRIITGELRKLFHSRLFVICLVVFFIANVFVLYYTQSNNYETQIFAENKTEYEGLISQVKSLNKEDAKALLEEQIFVCKISMELSSLNTSSDEYSKENSRLLLEQYKNENPKAYEQAEKLNYSKDKAFGLYMLAQTIENDLEYIDGYDSFIDEMQNRADELLSFSIFSQEGSFSYNNIQKTPQDFQSLKDVKLEVGNNIAVETATTFNLTDLMVFALVFLMCIYLFTVERDKNLYSLVRSTKKGRLSVIESKLGVLISLTVIITLVYYTANILTCGFYSGFGDMNRNIQSIDAFQNCSYNVTVLQYLILWIISKALTMCAIACVLSLIFVLIKNTATIFIVTAVGLSAEYVLFTTIDSSALLNHFKYINFFYMLSGNNVFGNYLNINFFTLPVNFALVFIVSVVLLIAVPCVISSLSFVYKTQGSKNSAIAPMLEKVRNKFSKVRGSVHIFSGECFKHYKGSLVALVFLLLIFFGYRNLTADINIVYQNSSDSAYSEYMNVLQGDVTKDKESYIANEQKYFDGLYSKIEKIQADKSLTEDEKQTQLSAVNYILESKGEAFELVKEQTEYIKSVGEEYSITPQYVNSLYYKRLLENAPREWEYFTLLIAVMIFSASNIFACEYKRGVVNLIRCTKGGKAKLVIAKSMVLTLTFGISYILIYLPYLINFITTFGADSFNTPLIFMQDFSGVESTLTIWQAVALIGVVHIAVAFAIAMLTMMFSNLLKNNIITMIVMSVVGLFPCFICINNTSARFFTALQNGSWHYLLPIIIALSIIIIFISITVTLINYSKLKLRK